jgi:phospholipid-binding lipoprotein MlaA
LGGCAREQEYTAPTVLESGDIFEENIDPFEEWNRLIFTFNEGFDSLVVTPVAGTYMTFVAPPIRRGITRVLKNTLLPVASVNWVLQGKIENALHALARFCINTIFGLGGFFDIVPEEPDNPTETSFSGTLRSWGVNSGPYFVIPFIGPSTLRDIVGFSVDFFIDPFNLLMIREKRRDIMSLRSWFYMMDQKIYYNSKLQMIRRISLDTYSMLREIYLQSTGSKDL